MLEGIKLLIERMDSNPEEFMGDLSYRWSHIMQDIAKNGPEYLDEEDLLALNRKVKEVRRRELNAKIVDEISTGHRLKRAHEESEMKAAQRAMAEASIASGRGTIAGTTMTSAWWNEILDSKQSEKIKKQNAMLEQSQAYKKRNNQPWP